MSRIKILIVDDHPILRKGLAMVINQEQDLVVAGSRLSGPTVLEPADPVRTPRATLGPRP